MRIAVNQTDIPTQRVANFFLEQARQEGLPLTAMKLQKLVYIAYGWHLALTGKKLFDEEIEAWKHGPVVPSLYHEFKHFRGVPITSMSVAYDYDSDEDYIPHVADDDAEAQMVLGKVWNIYKRFSGSALRNKTHVQDGPWDRVYDENLMGITLRDEDIAEHYQDRIRAYLAAANE